MSDCLINLKYFCKDVLVCESKQTIKMYFLITLYVHIDIQEVRLYVNKFLLFSIPTMQCTA